jgi:hypothetical protein
MIDERPHRFLLEFLLRAEPIRDSLSGHTIKFLLNQFNKGTNGSVDGGFQIRIVFTGIPLILCQDSRLILWGEDPLSGELRYSGCKFRAHWRMLLLVLLGEDILKVGIELKITEPESSTIGPLSCIPLCQEFLAARNDGIGSSSGGTA